MNKMASKENQKKQNFYIGLKEPRELRRNLLEASKSTILSMQVNQRMKDLQVQKEMLKSKLKKDAKEIKFLLLRLEKAIPEEAQIQHAEKAPKPEIRIPKKAQMTEETEFNKIEEHLQMIEEKLKRLK